LASNTPHLKDLRDYNISFILGVKPGSHESLFNSLKTQENLGKLRHFEKSEIIGDKVKKHRKHRFIWVNEVILNGADLVNTVNFLDYAQETEWVDTQGERQLEKVHFSWVTNFEIRQDNVFKLMRGGRSNWKIENETFNTLKNQGYEFEHNFGHGKNNLATVFAYLMMLAFLFDQIQQNCCKLFQMALFESKRKIVLWQDLAGLYRMVRLSDWDTFLSVIAYPDKWEATLDTS